MTAGGFKGFAWLAAHPWAYPALEALHITGITLLLGTLAVLELRATKVAWRNPHAGYTFPGEKGDATLHAEYPFLAGKA